MRPGPTRPCCGGCASVYCHRSAVRSRSRPGSSTTRAIRRLAVGLDPREGKHAVGVARQYCGQVGLWPSGQAGHLPALRRAGIARPRPSSRAARSAHPAPCGMHPAPPSARILPPFGTHPAGAMRDGPTRRALRGPRWSLPADARRHAGGIGRDVPRTRPGNGHNNARRRPIRPFKRDLRLAWRARRRIYRAT